MIVIKIGGGEFDAGPLLEELAAMDRPWIMVHGGNRELTRLQKDLGHPPRFLHSPSGHESRYTDAETMACIQRVYRGRINNDLVLRLQRLGCHAVGLSGIDGALWQAKRKGALRAVVDGKKMLVRDDLSGRIHTVNTHLLDLLLTGGYRPVLTLPALADTGEAVNVDGDRAAAMVASAMHASDLVILSDVPGLLRDRQDADSLVAHIAKDDIDAFAPLAQGRFQKKLIAAHEALHGGVARVTLAAADVDRPVSSALAGKGTVIA